MLTTTVVVIGGGQAGLAVSRLLTELAVDHVVLEQGTLAHRWRTRGWDSLTLLTPRWFSRLPHWRWTGPDPHGYMSRHEVVGYLEDFALSFAAPVAERSEVLSVRQDLGRFRVATTAGCWQADDVVVATGHSALPHVPDVAGRLGDDVLQVASDEYRNPGDLPAGGVLVVGASASGVQIADELNAAGREVVLAVGRHTRVPRRYRGRDVIDWLVRAGAMDRPRTSLPDPANPPHEPSMQLVGRTQPRELDLASLQARGVALAGRLTGAARPDPSRRTCRPAPRDVARLLERHGLAVAVETGARYLLDPFRKHEPTLVSDVGRERRVDLLNRAVAVAADLGAGVVHLWSGILPDGVSEESGWDRVLAGVETVLTTAERAGITLAVEPEPGMFLDRAARVDELLDRLGRPERLRMTLDLGHLTCNEDDPVGVLRRHRADVVHVQVDDMRRGVHEHLELGTGEVDLPPLLGLLARTGYTGLVGVELPRHSHAARRPPAPASAAAW
ncbi:TIM barrel protein [Georgenia sp. SUBG003]|uniref:TIM barrel protein n=1 Tax=Georgenia sp. SUBG003 TaxID=1497974 RepID=UPI003AB5C878